ncbi:MAG: hypothetical protein ACFCVH_19400 [Alphaproteobacteria bacterium]
MKREIRAGAVALALAGMQSATVAAGEADVLAVTVAPEGGDRYRFEVTVAHEDEGWEHYADLWQVLAPDGTVLGERELLHPHETEQPFTRSLSGVSIPPEVDTVTIRARDSVHGFGGAERTVDVPR